MQDAGSYALFLAAGLIGGFLGMKIKLPGSVLICAMLSVMLVKMLMRSNLDVPGNLDVYIQIALGIRVGMSYTPELVKQFTAVAIPVVSSCLVLVLAGLLMALVLVKFNLLNIPDAYLSTSPGAMTALISLSLDSSANPSIVAAFHFFRITFIILTAPLAYSFLRHLVDKS